MNFEISRKNHLLMLIPMISGRTVRNSLRGPPYVLYSALFYISVSTQAITHARTPAKIREDPKLQKSGDEYENFAARNHRLLIARCV